MDKLDHLKFCVERFDHYYDSVNNKSALFLTINTFIVGGLVAIYPSLRNYVDCGACILILLSLILAVGLASIFATLLAGIPFLSKPGKSNLYFGSIAGRERQAFLDDLKTYTSDQQIEDYSAQVHILALGLNRKFEKLQYAGSLIFVEFLLAIPFIILLINNLKK